MNNAPHRRQESRRRIKRLTVSALLCSLGVVILYFGALLDVFELCVVALAAMLIVPVVIEYGHGYPWAIYLGTSVLSILLLPQKMPGVTYLLFAFYPILKAYFERVPRPVTFVLKQVTFVVIEATIIVATNLILGVEKMPFWYNALLIVMGYLTLNLFDVALTRLITLYQRRYRARIARWMN
jgi:predicted anti-sigma-YlaC factor YlaD